MNLTDCIIMGFSPFEKMTLYIVDNSFDSPDSLIYIFNIDLKKILHTPT